MDDSFNMSMRKFLKQVGITSQKAIEDALRDAGNGSYKVDAKIVIKENAVDKITGAPAEKRVDLAMEVAVA